MFQYKLPGFKKKKKAGILKTKTNIGKKNFDLKKELKNFLKDIIINSLSSFRHRRINIKLKLKK